MKKSLFLLPILVLLSACGTKNVTPSPDGGNDITENPDTPVEPEVTYVEKQETFSFKGVFATSGANVFTTNPLAALKGVFGTLLDDTNEEGITGSSCAFQYVGGESPTSLCVGTGSYGGEINFKFNYDIKAISFTIQSYYKPYNTTLGVDIASEMTVEGVNYDLSSDGTSVPMEESHTYTLPSAKKTLSFSNSAAKHRAYLHELTITYLQPQAE